MIYHNTKPPSEHPSDLKGCGKMGLPTRQSVECCHEMDFWVISRRKGFYDGSVLFWYMTGIKGEFRRRDNQKDARDDHLPARNGKPLPLGKIFVNALKKIQTELPLAWKKLRSKPKT